MKRWIVLVLVTVAALAALDWVNTGELDRALTVPALIIGPHGYLYAGANIDTTTVDSGWVFVATDFWHWQRCGDIPGDVRRLYCLLNSRGDTLFAGTQSSYQGADSGHLYISTDGGTSWLFRSRLRGPRVGPAITALLEDIQGNIHAGINYMGMSGYPPCRSSDRGFTWTQGPATAYNAYHYLLIQPADGNLYCGAWGTGGLVLKSTDGGANWAGTGTMFDAGRVTTIIEAPGGVLYAGTYPKTNPVEPIGRVFKTTDGGATWTEVGYGYFNNTTGVRALCRTANGNLFAGTAPNAEVFVSSDDGATWTSTGTLPGANVVYALVEKTIGDSNYLYAATGPNGAVFRARLLPPVGVVHPASARHLLPALRLWPNPTTGTISVSGLTTTKALVSVFDSRGALVQTAWLSPGQKRLRLAGRLGSGVYHLLVSYQGGTTTTTFLLLR